MATVFSSDSHRFSACRQRVLAGKSSAKRDVRRRAAQYGSDMHRRLRTGAIGIAASLLAVTGALGQRAPSATAMNTSQDRSILDPFVPTSGRVLLPFRLTNGYILVDASVNGTPGVFMFDTGTPMTFFLNRALAPLDSGTPLSVGKAASGQQFQLFLHDKVKDIDVASRLHFADLDGIRSADFSFVQQGIASDFLGFMGYPLFKPYEFTIDYAARHIAVRRAPASADGNEPPPGASTKIATFAVTAVGPQPGSMTLQAGTIELPALFDSGSPGVLNLTAPHRAALLAAGVLVPSTKGAGGTRDRSAPTLYALQAVTYQGQAFTIDELTVESAAADLLSIGYPFLKHYRSVWNATLGTVTLWDATVR